MDLTRTLCEHIHSYFFMVLFDSSCYRFVTRRRSRIYDLNLFLNLD